MTRRAKLTIALLAAGLAGAPLGPNQALAWQDAPAEPATNTDQDSAPAAEAGPDLQVQQAPTAQPRAQSPAPGGTGNRTRRDRTSRASPADRPGRPGDTGSARDRGRDPGMQNRWRTSRPAQTTRPAEDQEKPTESSDSKGYAAFRSIAERNIFNTQRSPRSPARPERERPTRQEQFTLVGTLTYEKGPFAFFDGSSSEYKKVLQPGQSVAGYKVAAIAANTVQLERDGKTWQLSVGDRMRQQDAEWSVEKNSPKEINPASFSSGMANVSVNEDEVLQRLIRQREQELK